MGSEILARGRRRHPAWGFLWVLLAGVVLAFTGCSQAVSRAGEEVVGKTLDAVKAEKNRRKLEELLTSPEVRKITRELAGEVVDEALEELTGAERQARLQALAVEFVDKLVPAIAGSLATEVWPQLEQALVDGVAEAMEQALSPEARARAKELAAEVARGVMDATAPRIAAAIARGVATGVETSVAAILEEQLGPALETLLAGDPPRLRRITREATHGVLLGIADAMAEGAPFDEVWDRERDEIIGRLAAEAARQQELLDLKFRRWAILLGMAALLLLLLAAFLFVRLRRVRRQVEA